MDPRRARVAELVTMCAEEVYVPLGQEVWPACHTRHDWDGGWLWFFWSSLSFFLLLYLHPVLISWSGWTFSPWPPFTFFFSAVPRDLNHACCWSSFPKLFTKFVRSLLYYNDVLLINTPPTSFVWSHRASICCRWQCHHLLWLCMKALISCVAQIRGCQGLSAEAGRIMMTMMMVAVQQWWLDWVKWVRSEVSGHASDAGVWCDPLAAGCMDSGQLSSCLSRPMQDAGSQEANGSEEVGVTLAEKFSALHFRKCGAAAPL